MGLDMYLSKRHYVQNWEHNGPEKQFKITVKQGGKKYPIIKTDKITYITEQVAYWRKANAIHEWFIQNCNEGNDQCIDIWVDRTKLQELYDTCVLVRDSAVMVDAKLKNGYTMDENGKKTYSYIKGKKIKDPSVAQDLLPTQSGFFFGGTDYDEYYMQDILHTIEVLKPELDAKYENGMYEPEYYYRPSW
jgi:hypothetical protein